MINRDVLKNVLYSALQAEIEEELNKVDVINIVKRALDKSIVKVCQRLVITVDNDVSTMGVNIRLHIPVEEEKNNS